MGRKARSVSGADEPPHSREATLADVLLGSLDDAATRELAERLRPHLPPAPARLLDAREAAALLGLHPDTLVKMARTGRVWAQKAGREWRFRADRLEILPRGGEASSRWQSAHATRVRAATARPSVAAIRGSS
jgi:excisionase family DNA binding protein